MLKPFKGNYPPGCYESDPHAPWNQAFLADGICMDCMHCKQVDRDAQEPIYVCAYDIDALYEIQGNEPVCECFE